MRPPDEVIPPGSENPYLLRWLLIPKNRLFNIYLHHMIRDDDDRALHDHPWLFNISILLENGYDELTKRGWRQHREGAWVVRFGAAPHRLALRRSQPAWSLFITGPRVRRWGFLCPQGWRYYREFEQRGCD